MYLLRTNEQGLYLHNNKSIHTKGIIIYIIFFSDIYIYYNYIFSIILKYLV